MDLTSATEKLAEIIRENIKKSEIKFPFFIGLTGGQGSGKSTLSKNLTERLNKNGLTTLNLCLDNFYYSKKYREQFLSGIHPLAATRGVPGTHDIDSLYELLDKCSKHNFSTIGKLPKFDKLVDDLDPNKKWKVPRKFHQIIILEGWCVGVQPSFISEVPVTRWEKFNDPAGTWKSWSKNCSHKYQKIWDFLDQIILLKQENFQQVITDKIEQEKKLRKKSSLSKNERKKIEYFCGHFESWTQGIWSHFSKKCDVIIEKPSQEEYIF